MRALGRRRFLAAMARAGLGSAALAVMPAWARAATIPGHRNADILVRNDWPEHWETSLGALGRSWITPADRFFVRSHFPVPDVDVQGWRLEVRGLVHRPLTLTLAEVRALPKAEAVHTLECAGNGRARFALKNTSGTQWEWGAVGNARWSGVKLATLLERAGVKPEAAHVWFEAADHATLPGVPPFLRSIPLAKATDDVLLATQMKGAALPKLHGAPLRAVVPGWFGMASAKWVTRIRVEAAPSDNHFMIRGYRYAAPGQDPTQAAAVEQMRVKSVITAPLDGARVRAGRVEVRGFAWSAADVARVEVSNDDGATWKAATLGSDHAPGAWRAWSAIFEIAPRASGTLLARATDDAGRSQPMTVDPNSGGYGNNSIQRVTVHASA